MLIFDITNRDSFTHIHDCFQQTVEVILLLYIGTYLVYSDMEKIYA